MGIPIQPLRVPRLRHNRVRLDEAPDGRVGPSPSTLQTSARTRLPSPVLPLFPKVANFQLFRH